VDSFDLLRRPGGPLPREPCRLLEVFIAHLHDGVETCLVDVFLHLRLELHGCLFCWSG
jgi:hypothetical protein